MKFRFNDTSNVRDRLAFKQTRMVVFVSFLVGLMMSAVQVYLDLQTHTNSLDHTIMQIAKVVQQPAAQAAYHLDTDLADEVAKGLFAFKFVVDVTIVDNLKNELTSQKRALTKDPQRWISHLIFADTKTLRIPLKNAEDDSVTAGFLSIVVDNHILANDFLNRSYRVLIIGVIRNFILAGILSFIFFYHLAKPLHDLAESIKKIDPISPAKNKLSVPRRHEGDELAFLASSTNVLLSIVDEQMVESEKANLKLQDATDYLEIQVADRTAELEEQYHAAEAANYAKSNFLATMSHEIRTPLNGILGLAELLTHSSLDPEQVKKLDIIVSSGNTLLAIINDVLEMSRIEAGGIEMEENAFILQDLVSTVATPFQNLADEKGVDLIVENEAAPDISILGDPVRLRQILWNLLSNALKFTAAGKVSVKVSEIKNTETQNDPLCCIQFSIRDTGTGIALDRLNSIFDAFTQEDNSIARKFGGTGLGLAIVKNFSELMKGTITVNSRVGDGTEFVVTIPFKRADTEPCSDQQNQEQIRQITSSEPLNILVAEDNETNAMIALSLLEMAGHTVRHVLNGQLAVEVCQEGWPDFILMDIHMPEMDGVQATERIRQHTIGAKLPIVGLTAEAFEERHKLFISAGMDGVLTKPYTKAQLLATIQQFRERSVHSQTPVEATSDLFFDFSK